MPEDTTTTLFFELFSGLPRQGPGDTASTLRALSLVPDVGSDTRILDVGCGTGLQTRVLARNSPASIVAIDNHPPFVDILNEEARRLGLADRLEARVGDMNRLDFADASFDLIWCEGAIYNAGVEAALRDWSRLLARGGHVAFSEVCWTQPDPPAECVSFWKGEYPAIRDVGALLTAIATCGYDTVGHFMLPRSAWWDDYYRPLEQNATAFRKHYRGRPEAQELADCTQREIDVWKAYSDYYGYAFFVARPTRAVSSARL
ncbi:MAG: methyltransferase domain-containing protein [Deltaproteobacteria bacterium]|nr:methyltransferase domain-containing protein [Deltaproteobacteria bacterium]